MEKNHKDTGNEPSIVSFKEKPEEIIEVTKNLEINDNTLQREPSRVESFRSPKTMEIKKLITTIFSEDLSLNKNADIDIRRVIEKEMIFFEKARDEYENRFRRYKIVITLLLVIINILQILGMLASSAVAIWFPEHSNKVIKLLCSTN